MDKNMYENFKNLEKSVYDSISKSDLELINNILKNIKEPTLVSGVGGAYVVSNYVSKVLQEKNNIIATNLQHRDLNYMNINNYKNIISCTYGARNYGVEVSLNNNLNKYVLSRNKKEGVTNINYATSEIENSFIALSATLVPMSILLLYYCDNDMTYLNEILNMKVNFDINDKTVYEILSGYETSTAATFLESTFTESGIGTAIVHDKYDYCHGRSTLNYNFDNNIIFFNSKNELDKLYDNELKNYYKNIIKIDRKYADDIINDYYLTYISMLLCKEIAKKQNKDLSIVEYSPFVKKLYYYKGNL